MSVIPPRRTFDVCIVGSGAGGGMAAYALAKAGADVLLMEAGDVWYGSRDAKMMFPNYASPRRGGATRLKPFGEFDGCEGGRSEEHTSELQSQSNLVCRLLLEKKNKKK